MLHPYQILLPLLSLFWVRVDLTDLFPIMLPVELVEIMDGDTLMVKTGSWKLRLRLSGIDAPELGQRFHRSRKDAGKFSRKCLSQIIPEEKILIIRGFDMYSRILGDLGNLTERAVERGCAGLYPHANFGSISVKIRYLRLLSEAKKNRRGVWAHGGYMVPKKWRRFSKRSGYRR